MKLLYSILPPFDKLLGPQAYSPQSSWRPIAYLVQQPVPEGLLLYNTLTKALALLDAEEAESFLRGGVPSEELARQWFLVPQDHDDRQLAIQIRHIVRMLSDETVPITTYTIFTTTDCNARCFYCFQKEAVRHTMSPETARQTADFILAHSAGKHVRLQWFGGEPLYNKKAISLICKALQSTGITYESGMISNGFLFDDSTIQEAAAEWRLKDVQITLDGTEEVYNRVKAFIYPEVNAFRRVIRNIHGLLDAGIAVRIRMNVDLYNADNLIQLTQQLCSEFKGTPGFRLYTHPLFGEEVAGAAIYHEDKRKLLYQKRETISRLAREDSLTANENLRGPWKIHQCMADDDSCVTILPDGHIGKCEHFSDEGFVGHIGRDGLDEQMLLSYKALRDETDSCRTCPHYPSCIRLNRCVYSEYCFPEMREEMSMIIRQYMLETYKKLKEAKDA